VYFECILQLLEICVDAFDEISRANAFVGFCQSFSVFSEHTSLQVKNGDFKGQKDL
jgi:hypothetical protein